MGKRKFQLSVMRKNNEQKRWGYFPVRIPIKGGVSVFKVSIPLATIGRVILPQPQSTTPLLISLLSESSVVEQPTSSCEYRQSGILHVYTIYIITQSCACLDTVLSP